MTGTIIPLYDHSKYPDVVAQAKLHPGTPFIVIINPDSGPGLTRDNSFQTAIDAMQAVGIKVVGYIFTRYGARAISDILLDIDTYHSFYPNLQGFNYDEFATSDGQEAYYTSILAYQRQVFDPLSLAIGNPGAATIEKYFEIMDIITIYESAGLPLPQTLQTRSFGRAKQAGYLSHDTPVLDSVAFAATLPFVGWVFVTNLLESQDPWAGLPSYFASEVSLLDTGVVIPPPPNPPPNPIPIQSFAFSGTFSGMFIPK